MRYYHLFESFDTKNFELKLNKILKSTILEIINLKVPEYYLPITYKNYYLFNKFCDSLTKNVTELIRNDVVKYSDNGKTIKLYGKTIERSIDDINFKIAEYSNDEGHYDKSTSYNKTIIFVNVYKYKKIYHESFVDDWNEARFNNNDNYSERISEDKYRFNWLFQTILHEYTHLLQDIKSNSKTKSITDMTYKYYKNSPNRGKRGIYNIHHGENELEFARYLSQRIESGANANSIVGSIINSISDISFLKSIDDFITDFNKPKKYDTYYKNLYKDLIFTINMIKSYNNDIKQAIENMYYEDLYMLYYRTFKENNYNYDKPEELKKIFNRFMKDIVNGLNKRKIDPEPYVKLAREIKLKYKIKE